MDGSLSAGARLRAALQQQSPLQIVGTINAYCAMMATHVGFQALYLSGAGVANYAYGLPDLGMTSLTEVAEEARRITQVTHLPLLVDIDTGWGSAFNIARAIQTMERVGVAAVHIEDQVGAKRCGHRPGKEIVSTQEMIDRIKTAADARRDASFVIMARTDAIAKEGLDAGIERLQRCIEAGADMVFPEAVTTLADYQKITRVISVPVLANITEFGVTPIFSKKELSDAGVKIILYPLSAARAMNKAALEVFQTIKNEGSQQKMLEKMQPRKELYEFLNYYAYEQKLDELFGNQNEEKS